MSVADWFKEFCNDLVVSNVSTISYRYHRITKQLNKDFYESDSETTHSRYVGSYGRNTAIGGFSDLDMIFKLPSYIYTQYDSYITNGQSALLQEVKKSIEKTYSPTSIRADGQVVVVTFTDEISFEVVPVFLNTAGSYTFPDANNGGRWRLTNPLPEIEVIKSRNRDCNNNLIPLCRMARAWRNKWNVPIGGLLIDTLAYQFIEKYCNRDKSYLYYDFMSRDFFKWLSEQSCDQEYWKAPGSGQQVYGKGRFQYKAKQCYNIALQAIEYQDKSMEFTAKSKWREIYGTSFPT